MDFLKAHKRSLIMLLVLALFLYAVIPQVAGLERVVGLLRRAEVGYLALALACWAIIYTLAVSMYQILALYPLKFWRTMEAQVASGFTGKLLPSGLGVVGLYIQYLRKMKHTTGEAVAVASFNNLAAIWGHMGLIVMFLLAGTPLPGLDFERVLPSGTSLLLAGSAVLLVIVAIVFWRRRLVSFWRSVVKTLRVFKAHPRKLVLAVLVSVPQTMAYIGVLYFSMLALGLELDFRAIFMVATFSMLAGTLIPVPGGIVGAEAGLTAALMAYGFSFREGLSVALLYRAFIYWLPIVPGLVVFTYRRRDYM